MESVATPGTPTSTVGKPVKFPLSADRTKSLMVFPANSQHVFPGSRFTTNQVFIGLEIHGTILIPVQNRVQSPKIMEGWSILRNRFWSSLDCQNHSCSTESKQFPYRIPVTFSLGQKQLLVRLLAHSQSHLFFRQPSRYKCEQLVRFSVRQPYLCKSQVF